MARTHPWLAVIQRMLMFWLFFVGPALTLPFLVISWLLPYGIKLNAFSIKARLLLLINMVSFGSLLIPIFFSLHYAAPMVCAWYALLLFSLRRVSIWDHRGRQKGKFLVRTTILVCITMAILRVSAARYSWSQDWSTLTGLPSTNIGVVRAQILNALNHQGRQHLVIVRYGPDHNPHLEWVYNLADIDGSRVVWARDMGDVESQEL